MSALFFARCSVEAALSAPVVMLNKKPPLEGDPGEV